MLTASFPPKGEFLYSIFSATTSAPDSFSNICVGKNVLGTVFYSFNGTTMEQRWQDDWVRSTIPTAPKETISLTATEEKFLELRANRRFGQLELFRSYRVLYLYTRNMTYSLHQSFIQKANCAYRGQLLTAGYGGKRPLTLNFQFNRS